MFTEFSLFSAPLDRACGIRFRIGQSQARSFVARAARVPLAWVSAIHIVWGDIGRRNGKAKGPFAKKFRIFRVRGRQGWLDQLPTLFAGCVTSAGACTGMVVHLSEDLQHWKCRKTHEQDRQSPGVVPFPRLETVRVSGPPLPWHDGASCALTRAAVVPRVDRPMRILKA